MINRATIARAGLAVLDRHGLEGLTMRAVATSLGVQAPALYWHVKNRRDLIDAMGEEIFDDAVMAFDPSARPWDAFLASGARALRQAMLQYHEGARVFAGTAIWDSVDLLEQMLTAMTEAGFSPSDTARLGHTVFQYTVGFVIEEQARDGSEYPQDNPYNLETAQRHVDPDAHPMLFSMLPQLIEPDFDEVFEAGLAVILDGLRARLPARRTSPPRDRRRSAAPAPAPANPVSSDGISP